MKSFGFKKALIRKRERARKAATVNRAWTLSERASVASASIAVIAALVSAVNVALTYWMTNKRLEADFRPWLYADMAASKIYRNQSGGFTFPIKFHFHNIGHLPAFNVSVAMLGLPLVGDVDEISAQKMVCSSAEESRAVEKNTFGFTVFPNQENMIVEVGLLSFSQADVESAVKKLNFDGITPRVVGCVDYGQMDKQEHHQTGFAFSILTKRGRHPNSPPGTYILPGDPTTVEERDLVISFSPHSEAFYAN